LNPKKYLLRCAVVPSFINKLLNSGGRNMKKYTLLILVMASLMMFTSSYALAQISGATDTTKEGSLLVFPRVVTTNAYETYIIINNNSPNDVHVKCYWEIKDVRTVPTSQSIVSDFTLHMAANSPVVFRASDGSSLDGRGVAVGLGYSEEGVLRCWAVDPTDRKQISWNHLSGSAIIVNSDNTVTDVPLKPPATAWQYNAWRFAANVIDPSGTFADGFWTGAVGDDVNKLALKASPTTVVSPSNCPGPDYTAAGCSLPNAAYDACPKYTTFEFLAEPSAKSAKDGYAFNNLALAPCKSDLTDLTSNTITRLKYTVWNEREVKLADLYQCAGCAYQYDLGNLAVGRNLKFFQKKNLKTPVGLFRVEGIAGTSCGADSVATPLLGVMSSRLVGGTAMVGSTGSTAGKETSDYGYILWTPTGEYCQTRRR
jgi:hypothetical protein